MMRLRRFVIAAACFAAPLPVHGQGPLPVVAEHAFRIDETVPTIAWSDARAYVDREVFVVGRIAATKRTRTMCFLDFDRNDRTAMTIVIRGENLGRFDPPPDKACLRRNVRVHGWVSEFQGNPQIMISRPEAITILPDDAPLPPPRAATSRPAPKDPAIVTVATYNAENLFDAFDDPYAGDENTPVKSRPALEALAKTIRAADADVLALEEVENRGILEQFNRVLLADLGYTDVVLFEGNDARGIDVALLTRLPVGPVTSHRHLRFKTNQGTDTTFRRDLLRVRLEPPRAPPFDVFVAHFKSKEGGETGGLDIRLAEARAARSIFDGILAREPEARFVVCGDFNDLIDSEPLKMMLGHGETALKTFHEDGATEPRITFTREPYRSMIDYILCSPAMAKCYVPKSYRVIEAPAETPGSDHNPVVVQFRIR